MQTTSQNRPKFRLCILAAFALTVLLMVACDGKAKKQAVKPAPPNVEVADVTQEKVPIVMEFSGTIKAIKTVDITPRVSGYIDERQFEEGTFVKEGDPLYLIDPRPYKSQLDAYQAQLKLIGPVWLSGKRKPSVTSHYPSRGRPRRRKPKAPWPNAMNCLQL